MVTEIKSLKSLRRYGEKSTPGDKCMHYGSREKERSLGTVIPAKSLPRTRYGVSNDSGPESIFTVFSTRILSEVTKRECAGMKRKNSLPLYATQAYAERRKVRLECSTRVASGLAG